MTDDSKLYARVSLRLIPFLFACYVCAYLDRVNVGFAKLQMLDELGWSEVVYGFGAGIFFIGYFFFEVPSNLLMLRIGARRTIARIMIAWALISDLELCLFPFPGIRFRFPFSPFRPFSGHFPFSPGKTVFAKRFFQ